MSLASAYTVKVEIAADGGPLTASPAWTDASALLRAADSIQATRGKQSEQSSASPGSLSFTVAGWAGDDPPDMIGRRVRITTTSPTAAPIAAGHITDWIDTWDDAGTRVSQVTAVGILEALARGESQGLYRSALAAVSPLLWWPLDEPAGSSAARDVVNGLVVTATQTGSGGTIDLGAGPVFDERTWSAFTPVGATNGKYLQGPLSDVFRGDQDFTISCVSATTTLNRIPCAFLVDSTTLKLGQILTINHNGSVGSGLTYNGSWTYGAQLGDGLPHHFLFTYTAATNTVAGFIDGVACTASATSPSPVTTEWSYAAVGGAPGFCFDGNVADVAVWQRALSGDEAAALWDAASHTYGIAQTQAATGRFDTLATAAGVPSELRTRTGTAGATMCRQPVAGGSLADALADVETAEQGIVGETAEGKVALWCADQRRSTTPAATLDARSEVLNDFRLSTSTSGLVNEHTATSGLTGALFTVLDEASITANGRRSTSSTVYLADDDDTQMLAGWLAHKDAVPSPRSDQIVVDMETLTRTGTYANVLALELGDLLQVGHLPDGSTRSLEVVGFNDDIGSSQWRRTIRVAPIISREWWVLDSATLSQLDTTTKPGYIA